MSIDHSVPAADPATGTGLGDEHPTAVHLVTLGCARTEVDSEELAARLADGGFRLVADPLIDSIRQQAPGAGIRSDVIVGFPGETDDDVQTSADFLVAARLDAIGVFGYSDETDTEAAGMTGKISDDEIEAWRAEISDLADELVVQRSETMGQR